MKDNLDRFNEVIGDLQLTAFLLGGSALADAAIVGNEASDTAMMAIGLGVWSGALVLRHVIYDGEVPRD